MNMKKRTIPFKLIAKALMIMPLLGVVGKLYAYDFSAVCETGQSLYYNIIDASNHHVELTYPGSFVGNPCGSRIPRGTSAGLLLTLLQHG